MRNAIGIATTAATTDTIATSLMIMRPICAGVAPADLSSAISVLRWRTERPEVAATPKATMNRPQPPITSAIVVSVHLSADETPAPPAESISEANDMRIAAPRKTLRKLAVKALVRKRSELRAIENISHPRQNRHAGTEAGYPLRNRVRRRGRHLIDNAPVDEEQHGTGVGGRRRVVRDHDDRLAERRRSPGR